MHNVIDILEEPAIINATGSVSSEIKKEKTETPTEADVQPKRLCFRFLVLCLCFLLAV